MGVSGKRVFGSLLFIIALVATVGFIFLLFAGAENIGIPLVERIDTVGMVVGIVLGVIFIILALMLLVRSGAGRDEADEGEMFFIPEKDRLELAYSFQEEEPSDEPPGGLQIEVYNLPGVTRQEHAWGKPEQKGKVQTYHFPRSVEGALYTNDYITIDHQGTKLKLRTLIAGPKGAQKGDLPRVHKRHIDFLKTQEGERRLEEEEAQGLQDVEPGDGEEFMAALERKAKNGEEEPTDAGDEVFYGYGGENPAVDRVEGVGTVDAERLRRAGVHTASRLLYEDPGRLAQRAGLDRADVQRWQATAELMKVTGIGPASAATLAAAGVRGISDLKGRSASAISDDVNAHVDRSGGSRVSVRRVEGWQEAAKQMRRTRQRVPAT